MDSWDVVVVGSGCAGATAALCASKAGTRTLLLEKKPAIGTDIRCAETISRYLMPLLPFKIPDSVLVWSLDGMRFVCDDVEMIRKEVPWQGYHINKGELEQWIVERGKHEGLSVMTSAEYVKCDGNQLIVKKGKKLQRIGFKILIGADGARSRVSRLLGAGRYREGDIGSVLGFEASGVRNESPHLDQIFFGNFAPGAYGYIMPSGDDSADIGVGMNRLVSHSRLFAFFKKFVKSTGVRTQIGNVRLGKEKSGFVPISHISRRWANNRVLLVGDAANQNLKPFTEGILPGIICGEVAGSMAARAALGDTKVTDKVYRKAIYDKLPHFLESDKVIRFMQGDYFSHPELRRLIYFGLYAGIWDANGLQGLQAKSRNELLAMIRRSER